jgi:hypothetical protein
MGMCTLETARLAGQKSRRGPAKKDPIVHDAMEILLTEGITKLYEKMTAGCRHFQEIKKPS